LIFGTPAEDLLPRGDDLEAILIGAVDCLEKPLAPVDLLRFIGE
jgi:BarA-like signal transduction histidine kinase